MSLLDRIRPRRANAESETVPQAADETGIGSIEGERRESVVQGPPSLQSRLTNLLALGLMGGLGLGLLGWYYAHSWDRRAKAQVAAQSSAQDKAKGDVILRLLGRVDPPVPEKPSSDSALENILGEAPVEPPTADIQRPWVQPASESVYPPRPATAGQRQRRRRSCSSNGNSQALRFRRAGSRLRVARAARSLKGLRRLLLRAIWTVSCDRASRKPLARKCCRRADSYCPKAHSSIARLRPRSIAVCRG